MPLNCFRLLDVTFSATRYFLPLSAIFGSYPQRFLRYWYEDAKTAHSESEAQVPLLHFVTWIFRYCKVGAIFITFILNALFLCQMTCTLTFFLNLCHERDNWKKKSPQPQASITYLKSPSGTWQPLSNVLFIWFYRFPSVQRFTRPRGSNNLTRGKYLHVECRSGWCFSPCRAVSGKLEFKEEQNVVVQQKLLKDFITTELCSLFFFFFTCTDFVNASCLVHSCAHTNPDVTRRRAKTVHSSPSLYSVLISVRFLPAGDQTVIV